VDQSAMNNRFEHSKIVLKYLRSKTSEVILFYSGGRDSIVLLDMMAAHFKHVHVVFMYFLPDMRVYTPYLNFVKKYNNITLYQYQHWNTINLLRAGYLCNAHRVNVPNIKLKDIEQKAREDTGCEYMIFGYKRSDGLSRNIFLKTYLFNAINEKAKKAFPLAEWSQKDVSNYISSKNLLKPIVFRGQKTNGIGLNEKAMLLLRDRFPDDLQKVLKVFPYAEKILFEHDYRQQNTPTSKV
jgi:sulfate adenylyltransferase subunit 2